MPRGRPKKEEVKSERLKEHEKKEIKQEAFSTEDIPTASYLEKNGIMAVSITGSPLIFTFHPKDFEHIKELLERR